jgi:hypothetical protein
VQNIRSFEDEYTDESGYVAAVYIRLDKQYDYFERKVSDVLTLLAAIGGLHKALMAIGVIVVSLVA